MLVNTELQDQCNLIPILMNVTSEGLYRQCLPFQELSDFNCLLKTVLWIQKLYPLRLVKILPPCLLAW